MLAQTLRRRRGAFNGFPHLQIFLAAASDADPCARGCSRDWQVLIEDSETIASALSQLNADESKAGQRPRGCWRMKMSKRRL